MLYKPIYISRSAEMYIKFGTGWCLP